MKAQTVEVMSRFLEIAARTAYDTKKPGTAYCDVKVDNEDVAEEIISAIETDETKINDLLDILELGKSLVLYAKTNLIDDLNDKYGIDDWKYEELED